MANLNLKRNQFFSTHPVQGFLKKKVTSIEIRPFVVNVRSYTFGEFIIASKTKQQYKDVKLQIRLITSSSKNGTTDNRTTGIC